MHRGGARSRILQRPATCHLQLGLDRFHDQRRRVIAAHVVEVAAEHRRERPLQRNAARQGAAAHQGHDRLAGHGTTGYRAAVVESHAAAEVRELDRNAYQVLIIPGPWRNVVGPGAGIGVQVQGRRCVALRQLER